MRESGFTHRALGPLAEWTDRSLKTAWAIVDHRVTRRPRLLRLLRKSLAGARFVACLVPFQPIMLRYLVGCLAPRLRGVIGANPMNLIRVVPAEGMRCSIQRI